LVMMLKPWKVKVKFFFRFICLFLLYPRLTAHKSLMYNHLSVVSY
jgi:hypothetical protein